MKSYQHDLKRLPVHHRQEKNPFFMKKTKEFCSPEELYGKLFVDVQLARIFEDGKTFTDLIPIGNPKQIVKDYEYQKKQPSFNLKDFVNNHFKSPYKQPSIFISDKSLSVEQHIEKLWDALERESNKEQVGTLIPLPYPYIVPGGRFEEVFYWDAYFTSLGLVASGKLDMVEHMLDNFAYLIDTIGFVPNGNRTYFLTRSQPPFFACMVQLLAETKKDDTIYRKYLPQLEKEYAFWMDGKKEVNAINKAINHVVYLDKGLVLNRYFDKSDTPRAEMYADDVASAKKANRKPNIFYSEIKAACESGWDFSTRWFEDGENFNTINCTSIIPVDLNALMYNLEKTLEKAYLMNKDAKKAAQFAQYAIQRKTAINTYCWDKTTHFYKDYNFNQQKATTVLSLAAVYPLYFKLANQEQAAQVAMQLENIFLKPGGLPTTLNYSGQQWDAPNGWAPLQWLAIKGLRNYDFDELAEKIKNNWINLNTNIYQQTGKLVEKYDVENIDSLAGGGEYPLQDGFGWTNGVLLKLLKEKS